MLLLGAKLVWAGTCCLLGCHAASWLRNVLKSMCWVFAEIAIVNSSPRFGSCLWLQMKDCIDVLLCALSHLKRGAREMQVATNFESVQMLAVKNPLRRVRPTYPPAQLPALRRVEMQPF